MKKMDKGFLGKLLRDFFSSLCPFFGGDISFVVRKCSLKLAFSLIFYYLRLVKHVSKQERNNNDKRYGIQFQRNREEMAAAMD